MIFEHMLERKKYQYQMLLNLESNKSFLDDLILNAPPLLAKLDELFYCTHQERKSKPGHELLEI